MTKELIMPPAITVMMSGVCGLTIDEDESHVQLEYTDGTLESAELTAEEIEEGRTNFFAFVSAVQSRRKE